MTLPNYFLRSICLDSFCVIWKIVAGRLIYEYMTLYGTDMLSSL